MYHDNLPFVHPENVLFVHPDNLLVVHPDNLLVVHPDNLLVVHPDNLLVVHPDNSFDAEFWFPALVCTVAIIMRALHFDYRSALWSLENSINQK